MPSEMSEPRIDKLEEAIENMFLTILGLDVWRNPAAMIVGRGQDQITASVQVSGAWAGVVSLSMSLDLSTTLAAIMFDCEPSECTDDEVADAMGELANVAGGAFKSSLEGICQLGLPVVTQGRDYVVRFPGAEVQAQTGYECEHECFHATMLVKKG